MFYPSVISLRSLTAPLLEGHFYRANSHGSAKSSILIGSSADGFATAGCLSGNTRFVISPSHFVGS